MPTLVLASETTDLVSAWATAIGAGGALLTVLVTAVVAIGTLRAAKRDSRDRSRPMVGVDLRPGPHATTYFVLRNYGPSPAYNVTVTVTPPFEKMDGDLRDFGRHITRRYEHPVPTLMGGSELSNLIGSLALGDQPQVGQDRFTVVVTYDDDPKAKKRPTYTNTYVLDPAVFALETKTTSSRDPEVSLAKLARTLDTVANELKRARRSREQDPTPPLTPSQEN